MEVEAALLMMACPSCQTTGLLRRRPERKWATVSLPQFNLFKAWRRQKVKPPAQMTLGDLFQDRLMVVTDCDACGVRAYLTPESLHLLPNVELGAMERFYCCPHCNNTNGEGRPKFMVRHSGILT
ncbi:hypothetical protein [Aestuariivirga sp.]|uniref:hypothetical protein n=1 Tax=Aestuariivirga sp. TaxID=2650926 RepID=UPI0039E64C19